MFKSLTISSKIYVSLSILILGYLFSMVYGFVQGRQTETSLHTTSDCLFPAAKHSQVILTAFNEEVKLYQEAVLMAETEYLDEAKAKSQAVQTTLADIAGLDGLVAEDKTEVDHLQKELGAFSELAYTTYLKVCEGDEDTTREKSVKEAMARLDQGITENRAALEALTVHFSDELRAKLAHIGEATRNQRYLNVAIFGVVVVSTLVIIYLIVSRSITKPINTIIASLSSAANQVTSSSGHISSSSQTLAEGATEQAASLEETSSSLEEMSSMTRQNADNAQQANTLASETRDAADGGVQSMGRMSSAIGDIQKSSEETAKIIKVIDEIAFQTNLLALNAAVEAARAGEAGKGFAVVAEEVRNLAMRSAEAAKNTSQLIEESVKNSNNGVDIVGEVSKVLDDIVTRVSKTTDLVSEIAAASQEQAQGIDQVNTAVSQMDKVTQHNAANAEESASASQELISQASSMNNAVHDLVVLIGGRSGNTQDPGISAPDRAIPVSSSQRLTPTDHAYHQIAKSAGTDKQKQENDTVAEQLIPMGDDSAGSDFSEFNN